MQVGLQSYLAQDALDADTRWMALPPFSLRKAGQFWELWQAFRRVDAVVLAGGTHFHDDYGPRSIRILLSHLAVFALARASGAVVGYAGIGVGPLRTRTSQRITRRILGLARATLVRDQASWDLVRTLAPGATLIRGSDAAMLLNPPPRTLHPGRYVLGISILPYFALHERTPENDDRVIAALSAAITRRHADDPSLVVRILVFFQGQRDSDLPISRRLAEAISPDVPVTLEECSGSAETLTAVAELDAFIATRYHAAVFGYLTGCPTLVVSYQEKCAALAAEIGLSNDVVWAPSDLHDEERLVRILQSLKEEPERFAAAVPVGSMAEATRAGLDEFARALVSGNPGRCRS